MFGFGKNKKEIKEDKALYAAFSGDLIAIEQVKDPVFSEKMMGEGFAIEPDSREIFAPVSGKVSLADGHALGFVRADGLELLLHIGLDTVSLKGKPFDFKVKVDDIVEAGESIGIVDFSAIESAGLAKTAVMVFTNTQEKLADFQVEYGQVQAADQIGFANVK